MKKILLFILSLSIVLHAAPYGKIGKEIVEWFGRKGLKDYGVKVVTGHADDYLKAVRKLTKETAFEVFDKKWTRKFGDALIKHGDGCIPIFKRFLKSPKVSIRAINNGGNEFVRTAAKYSDEVVESISRRGPEHFKSISQLGADVSHKALKANGDDGILKLTGLLGDDFFKAGLRTFDDDLISYLAKTGRKGGKVVKHLGQDLSSQVLKKTGREGLEALGKVSAKNVSNLKTALKHSEIGKHADYLINNSIKYGDKFLDLLGKHWKGIIAGTVVISILNDPAPWTELGGNVIGKTIETIKDITISAVKKVIETAPELIKDIVTPEMPGGGRSLKIIYLLVFLVALYLVTRKNKNGERFLFSLISDAKDEVKKQKNKKPKAGD